MKVVLRDAADINRLFLHLLTHWRLPQVEVGIGRLPALDSQRAQHRFVRLAGACNCLLGEMLGGVTLLGGSFIAWVSTRGWRAVGLVVVATVCVALVGKGIERAWTRVRLLLLLLGLRHRLVEVVAGRPASTTVKVLDPMLAASGKAAGKPFRHALNADDGEMVRNDWMQRPARLQRSRILLRDAGDINRLALRLFSHWTLPHIEIHVDALPRLEVERAQDRCVRLSAGCNYLLAGVLATASMLGGLFYIVWTSSQDYMWTSQQGWREVGLVAVATLYAALLGYALEALWIRVRLLLVLRGLRRRLRMA